MKVEQLIIKQHSDDFYSVQLKYNSLNIQFEDLKDYIVKKLNGSNQE